MHLVPGPDADPTELVLAVGQAVRATAGLLPTQMVLHEPGALPGPADGGRLLLRR